MAERPDDTAFEALPGAITGLATIVLPVRDLAVTKRFYIDQLGFVEAGEMPPGCFLAAGDARIYLEPGAAPETSAVSGVQPAWQCEAVQSCFDRLTAAGVEIVQEFTQYGPEFALFKARDPDGHIFEVAGRP